MAVTKDNYQSYYRQGIAQGFGIIDARQYYVVERNMTPDLEQMMSTPWTFEGNYVYGYSITDVGVGNERKTGARNTHTVEFWTFNNGNPVNLDGSYGGNYWLKDANGNSVSRNDAADYVSIFATAASYYPHVFMAPEFAEARNYLNARMELPPVNANDYRNYLNHIESQIKSGQFTFVGKITKTSDMHIAYESMDGMDEYEKRR